MFALYLLTQLHSYISHRKSEQLINIIFRGSNESAKDCDAYTLQVHCKVSIWFVITINI